MPVLVRLAAAEGINLQGNVADGSRRMRDLPTRTRARAGLPFRPETLQFAALLVRVVGEMVASGATSPEPVASVLPVPRSAGNGPRPRVEFKQDEIFGPIWIRGYGSALT